jgi:hypothetical protein
MKQVWLILFCILSVSILTQTNMLAQTNQPQPNQKHQKSTNPTPPEQEFNALIIYDDKGALVNCKNYDELTSTVTECSLVEGRTLDEVITFFLKKYNTLPPAQPEDTNSKQPPRHTA